MKMIPDVRDNYTDVKEACWEWDGLQLTIFKEQIHHKTFPRS